MSKSRKSKQHKMVNLSRTYQFSLHVIVGKGVSIEDETILSSISNHERRLGRFTKELICIEKGMTKGYRKLACRVRRIVIVEEHGCDCQCIVLRKEEKRMLRKDVPGVSLKCDSNLRGTHNP